MLCPALWSQVASPPPTHVLKGRRSLVASSTRCAPALSSDWLYFILFTVAYALDMLLWSLAYVGIGGAPHCTLHSRVGVPLSATFPQQPDVNRECELHWGTSFLGEGVTKWGQALPSALTQALTKVNSRFKPLCEPISFRQQSTLSLFGLCPLPQLLLFLKHVLDII